MVAKKLLNLKNLTPIIFFVLLIIIFGSLEPSFLTPNNFSTLLRQSSILLIVSLAAGFVIMLGSIDLSLGTIIAVTGITSALYVNTLGYWVLLVGPSIGLLIGMINGLTHVYAKIPSFLTTLGMMSILTGVGLIISKGTPIPIREQWFMKMTNSNLIGGIPNIFVWAFSIYLVCIFIQHKTRLGRYIYAIGGGERVAELSGVPVKRMKVYTFMLAGFICGLAGILLTSRIGSASSQMGDSFLMEPIAAVVMGGTALTGGAGGVHKNILGVLVISVLSNGMDVVGIHPYIKTLVTGIVIIMAVAFSMNRSRIEIVK